jgi:8-oxo-dGTP pyrophosphatase MutT (NUDIX family)
MMNKRRISTRAAVYLILRDGEQLLLARRCNTGFQDGNYSLVAGHVEADEAVTAALVREAWEETGMVLALADLEFVHVMHRHSEDHLVYFDFFFAAQRWSGEISNREPHKCDDLRWFSQAHLPVNTVPYVRKVVTDYLAQGQKFSELGWPLQP